jgi:hypothetical protein
LKVKQLVSNAAARIAEIRSLTLVGLGYPLADARGSVRYPIMRAMPTA